MYAWTRLIKGQHVVGPLIENRLWTYTVLIWTFFLVLVWGTHYWRLSRNCIYTIWCGIRHEVARNSVKCLKPPAATAGRTHLLTSRSEPPRTCVTHFALGSTSAPILETNFVIHKLALWSSASYATCHIPASTWTPSLFRDSNVN